MSWHNNWVDTNWVKTPMTQADIQVYFLQVLILCSTRLLVFLSFKPIAKLNVTWPMACLGTQWVGKVACLTEKSICMEDRN